jgi:peptidoglycan/LPS O-acetylase OafA/YrhL
MQRLDQLTITRFLALLLVLVYHGGANFYIGWAVGIAPLSALLFSAPTAVSYLYVLSGFVMPLVYYRPQEKFDVPAYWTARFVRIYPLYILSFVLTCYFYLDYIARIKPQKVLANIFVLQAWWPPYAQSFNYASWSITVEFFFYALFPFFTMWAYRQSMRTLILSSLGFWAVTQLVHFTLWLGYFPAWEFFLVYNPLFHMSTFMVGVVGGIWYVREARGKDVNQKLNLFLIFGSLALFCGYTILSRYVPQLPHGLQPMSGLLVPFFTLFIVTLAIDKTRLSSILSHRWLVILGETAFALYILHVPVIWLYERALFTSSLSNPELILGITYLPLMVSVGLISYFFIDPPMRAGLKNILKHVSMPLLILDLAIIAASAYFSFRLRFGDGREFLSYRPMALLMFWYGFIIRTSLSVMFKTLDPARLYLPLIDQIRSIFLSVTAGSIAIAVLVYVGYLAGWIGNFPRSIFLVDWAIILLLSFGTRAVFRGLRLYEPRPSAA